MENKIEIDPLVWSITPRFLPRRPAGLPDSWQPTLHLIDLMEHVGYLATRANGAGMPPDEVAVWQEVHQATSRATWQLARLVPKSARGDVLRLYVTLAGLQVALGALVRLGENGRRSMYELMGEQLTRLLEGDGFPNFEDVSRELNNQVREHSALDLSIVSRHAGGDA